MNTTVIHYHNICSYDISTKVLSLKQYVTHNNWT